MSTFLALLARDARVARRNLVPLLIQVLLQPMLFVFIFGQVMTRSGFLPPEYKSLLLPGIIAISMLLAGIQSVALPLITELQFTREIEDRLLAPIAIEWVAVEKILAGVLQALAAGLVVFPAAWLIMGGVELSREHPGLFAAIAIGISLLAATGGLALGCTVGSTQIGLLFTLVLGPIIFFGCTYYPWSALESFPLLQKLVLINPLVYGCEGLRAALAPQHPHLPAGAAIIALLVWDSALIWVGIRQFRRKTIS
ncbi:MAG TPA: ABC transporter permease [Acidobacteriota bacterium]